MNRCAARGCGCWTRAGEAFCRRHGQVPDTSADAEGERDRWDAFRAHLAAGDVDALLAPVVRQALRGVAAESGLDAEIGALRVAMARLLDEERDASRLASGVARVAWVAVQAERLRQGSGGEQNEVQATLQRVLAEIDAETEQRNGADGKEVMPNGTG